jgi:glucose-1-phosphate adenylyltransferase
MGIYVFDTQYLLRTLAQDRREVDFGMHIIPRAINEDRVYAYPFYGYWRDVGTIQSYWETNMDIIRENSGISPEEWEIRPNPEYGGRSMDRAPANFRTGCKVTSSMIASGCLLEGTVINSVLSPGVRVKKGAVVTNSVLFDDTIIEENAVVDLAICDKRVHVGEGAVVGYGENLTLPNKQFPKHLYTGISLVGKEARIPAGARIGRNCIVDFGYHDDTGGQFILADGESA